MRKIIFTEMTNVKQACEKFKTVFELGWRKKKKKM